MKNFTRLSPRLHNEKIIIFIFLFAKLFASKAKLQVLINLVKSSRSRKPVRKWQKKWQCI